MRQTRTSHLSQNEIGTESGEIANRSCDERLQGPESNESQTAKTRSEQEIDIGRHGLRRHECQEIWCIRQARRHWRWWAVVSVTRTRIQLSSGRGSRCDSVAGRTRMKLRPPARSPVGPKRR